MRDELSRACTSEAGGRAVDVEDMASPVAGGNAPSMVGGTDFVRRASEPVLAGLTTGIPVSDSGRGIAHSEQMLVPKTLHNPLHTCCSHPLPEPLPHKRLLLYHRILFTPTNALMPVPNKKENVEAHHHLWVLVGVTTGTAPPQRQSML